MSPDEAAEELRGELEAALDDSGMAPRGARVAEVAAPRDLGADRVFRIAVLDAKARTHTAMLPVPLAMGYLADEEAAVDEWKAWVAELSARLAT